MKTFFLMILLVLGVSDIATAQDSSKAPSTEKQKTLWTCGMHPQVIQESSGLCPICHMKLTPIAPSAGGEIRIDPVMAQNMGLRLGTVNEGPLHRRIRASGTLKEAEPRKFDVMLQVEGYISKLHADTEGMFLNKGDALYDLYSPELFYAQERYLNAIRVLEKQDSDGVPGSQEKNQSFLDSAKDNLRIWGMSEEDLEMLRKEGKARRNTTFRAPFSAFLLEKNVVPGSLVSVGSRLMRLVDLSVLWLDIQIFEQDLGMIKTGQKVEIQLRAFPGEKFEGILSFLDPRVDITTRSAIARVEIPNPGFRLKPGMFSSTEIEVEISANAVFIPREAVIDTGIRQIVFVTSTDQRYSPREVKLGFENEEGLIEIREGLMPTEKIVLSGQFLLDSESRFREAQEKWRSKNIQTTPSSLPTENFFHSYLKMSAALAMDQEKEASGLIPSLQNEIQTLLSHPQASTQRKLLEKLQVQAKELSTKTITEQRQQFQKLSETAIELLQAASPPATLSPKLFIAHCPMYPGSWIQNNEDILNPYYGAEMLHCGEIKKQLELKKP